MILGADTEREIVELLLVEAERIKPARITGIGQDGWRKRQQPIDEAVFVLLGALELLVFMRVPRAQRYTEQVGDHLDIAIGRTSCRERGCQYVSISVVAVS